MRLFIKTIFIFLILIFTSQWILANSSFENRIDWWNFYIASIDKNLKKYKKDKSVDPRIIKLLENKKIEAKKLSAILQKGKGNTGELTNPVIIFDNEKIKSFVGIKANKIFSILYLNAISNEFFSPKISSKYKNFIDSKLKEKVSWIGLKAAEFLRKRKAHLLSQRDYKRISRELLLSSAIKNLNNEKDNFTSYLNQKVEKYFSTKNRKTTEIVAQKIILKFAEQYYVDQKFLISKKYDFDISKSNSWKLLEFNLDKRFRAYKIIFSLLDENGKNIFLRLNDFYENPKFLSKYIFPEFRIRSIVRGKHGVYKKKKIILSIPKLSDYKIIINDIEQIRRNELGKIEGGELDLFFENINNEIKARINKRLNLWDGIIKNDEKLLLLNRTVVKNSREFLKAKKQYNLIKKNIYKTADKTIAYLRLISLMKSFDQNEFVQLYEKFNLSMIDSYDFIYRLLSSSGQNNFLEIKPVGKFFFSAVRRTGKFLNFFKKDSSFRKNFIKLNKNNYIKIKYKQKNYIQHLAKIRYLIRKEYYIFLSNEKKNKIDENFSKRKLTSSIAQYEIDFLYEGLKKMVLLEKSFNYSNEVFSDYANSFRNIYSIAKDGDYPKLFGKKIYFNSLLPFMKKFSKEKLQSSYSNRKIIIQKIKEEIARIYYVLNFYKRNRIKIRLTPERKIIQDYYNLTRQWPRVKIASWQMNNKNFSLVDRKAAALISKILQRRIWNSKKELDKRASSTKYILGKKFPDIFIYLPAGWEEVKKTRFNDNILSRYFSSMDRNYSIVFAIFSNSNREVNPKLKVRKLIGGVISFVEKKWLSKNKKRPTLWMLFKKDDYIIESYSIKYRGYTVILIGTSKRKWFRYFSRTFRYVFKSLSIVK